MRSIKELSLATEEVEALIPGMAQGLVTSFDQILQSEVELTKI